ncbi:hypothetical protein Tco_1005684 [Tanacetum coccineum]|uniref:Uncharacterized protein n=1 Tax=Tanacetum coccineum TaxID=301880 RepID=A0ABQ5FFF0_9ASTR
MNVPHGGSIVAATRMSKSSLPCTTSPDHFGPSQLSYPRDNLQSGKPRGSRISTKDDTACEHHGSFSINNFEVKILGGENPSEQSLPASFFAKEILKGGMGPYHYAFVHDEVRPEFSRKIHKATQMEGPSLEQSRLEASVSLSFPVFGKHECSHRKDEWSILSRRWVIGRDTYFEKS